MVTYSVPAAAPDAAQRLMAESLALDYRIGQQVRRARGGWMQRPRRTF